jgi:hypothetical protein
LNSRVTDYENAKKIRLADKNLRRLWSPLCLAKKVGKELGIRALLQRCVSHEKAPCGGEFTQCVSWSDFLPQLFAKNFSQIIVFLPT